MGAQGVSGTNLLPAPNRSAGSKGRTLVQLTETNMAEVLRENKRAMKYSVHHYFPAVYVIVLRITNNVSIAEQVLTLLIVVTGYSSHSDVLPTQK